MTKFFSRLSYSFGNEDWKTEKRALKLKPEDQVLCITASGDRPLNLLFRNCKKIVCIDANPIQNHLLCLKIAAMKSLNYQDYLAFLGVVPSEHRLKTLQKVMLKMNKETAHFWLQNKKMIQKGIIYQGAVERLTKITARCASIVRGKKIKRLFEMDDLEEQKKFVAREWDTPIWRKFFEFALKPFITRYIIEDPGLMNIGSAINPGVYFYERINESLKRDLAKKNLLLALLFTGKVPKESFPPYLTEEGIQAIKPRLQRLEVKTLDVITYLESLSESTFDVFSLSDVISYMSYPNFIRLLQAMIKTAKPGARFCLREFLSSHEIPQELQPYFIRDESLEQELEKQDNCFVYRFIVGNVLSDVKEEALSL